MPEIEVEPAGEDELTTAITEALQAWFDQVTITDTATASVTAAVRWPGRGVWGRLVEERVLPVSERLYRAAVSAVDGTALDAFLNGVRTRLVDESTIITDIQAAQEKYGDDAARFDWAGAGQDGAPWRNRANLLGEHEAQVTGMQAATDDAPPQARKRWVTRGDERVRATHRAINNQTRPMNEPFTVGGAELQYPGDPAGPLSETMRCRCSLVLVTPTAEDSVTASIVTAAVSVDTELPFAPRDTEWDGAAAKTAVREWATGEDGEVDESRAARAYLWRTDGPISDWKLPVATVRGGNLELVWNGVTAAAAAVQGARTPIDLPADDVDKVKTAISGLYRKAAEAFDDDSLVAPWDRQTEAAAIVYQLLNQLPADVSPTKLVAALAPAAEQIEAQRAAAARRSVMASAPPPPRSTTQSSPLPAEDDSGPWTPPAAWFQPPDGTQTELISPEGRVAGYVATWEDTDGAPMCHAGYAAEGECQTVPRGGDYSYFHQGNVTLTLDDGTRVHPGLLTTDIGHGPATPFVDQQVAHYDNPQAIAAAVIVGEDDKGIWMSGAVLPQVMKDRDKFTRLQLTPVSGHWSETQPGGPLELIAVTSVNKPGYPQRSTSGYALAASLAGSQVSDLQEFRAQLANMLDTIDGWLAGTGEDDRDRDDMGEEWDDMPPVAASAAPDTADAPEAADAENGAQEPTQAPEDATPDAPAVELDEVDPAVVAAAIAILPDIQKMTDKELAAAGLPNRAKEQQLRAAGNPHGIQLPRCLEILANYLENDGADSIHSRAAAVKAAEAICRSTDVQHAAVRARACRLVSEYRVKAGSR